MTRQKEAKSTLTYLGPEAIRLLDDAIARMGSDPCIYSIDLTIDQITSELATTADDHAAVRSLLRSQIGLDVSTPSVISLGNTQNSGRPGRDRRRG